MGDVLDVVAGQAGHGRHDIGQPLPPSKSGERSNSGGVLMKNVPSSARLWPLHDEAL
jgi:hypothetical protein